MLGQSLFLTLDLSILWNYFAFQLVAKRVQTIEKSATLIGPEFAAFQTQLASLLADLEERKKAGASPNVTSPNDQAICKKLEQLEQFAATTARVRKPQHFLKSF